MKINTIINKDVLQTLKGLPDECVDCIVTSPPYWGLRDYGVSGQIGLEPTLQEYLDKMAKITTELKRILKPTGVLWWNHGDCYGGSGCGKNDYRNNNKRSMSVSKLYCDKPNPQLCLTPKCKVLQNYRLVLRMIDEQGWILRNNIIWHKPNHMPSSVKDRLATSYEPVFLLVKNKKYWFDLDAIRQPHKEESINRAKYGWHGKLCKNHAMAGIKNSDRMNTCHLLGKNPGDVWRVPTQPFSEAHFATFPEKLVEPMIKAGCPAEICVKCGKARIRHSKDIGEKTWKNIKLADSIKTGTRGLSFGRTSQIITLGWIDCGCKAGFKPGVVLDPFMGSGTTALVALRLKRDFLGIELNKNYIRIAMRRIKPMLG